LVINVSGAIGASANDISVAFRRHNMLEAGMGASEQPEFFTPYEFIRKQWTIKPERPSINPIHTATQNSMPKA
jgi:hypothetical protein